MITGNRFLAWLVAGLAGISGVLPASAELPGLTDKERLGYFVGFQNNKFQYGITSHGESEIKVVRRNDQPLAKKLTLQVDFAVAEVMPDGKVNVRNILPQTLETTQPATENPKDIVFRGKVKGDASIEVFVNEDRGMISLGGRLLSPGTLTKNPTHFAIRIKFPDAYANTTKTGDKKQVKAFEDKIKGDRFHVTWSDRKRQKHDTDKPVDAGSKEINGPGITALEVSFSTYDDKKFEISASGGSVMALSNTQPAPLYDGFALLWTADPAKDPEGKARLNIEVK